MVRERGEKREGRRGKEREKEREEKKGSEERDRKMKVRDITFHPPRASLRWCWATPVRTRW